MVDAIAPLLRVRRSMAMSRGQPIGEVPGLEPTTLPWVEELVERKRVVKTPAPIELPATPDQSPSQNVKTQVRLF